MKYATSFMDLMLGGFLYPITGPARPTGRVPAAKRVYSRQRSQAPTGTNPKPKPGARIARRRAMRGY